MPVFPLNEVEIGPDVTRAPRIDINADAIGRGMTILGAGFADFGAMASTWEARQKQTAQEAAWQKHQQAKLDFDADARTRTFIGESYDALDQARATMAPDGRDFASRFIIDQSKHNETFAAALPPEVRARAAGQVLEMMPALGARAAGHQHQGELAHQRGILAGTFRGYGERLAQDPSQFEASRADLARQVDAAPNLEPDARQALKLRYDTDLAITAAKARYRNDPEGAARALYPAGNASPDASSLTLHQAIPEERKPGVIAETQAATAQNRALARAKRNALVAAATKAYTTIGRHSRSLNRFHEDIAMPSLEPIPNRARAAPSALIPAPRACRAGGSR